MLSNIVLSEPFVIDNGVRVTLVDQTYNRVKLHVKRYKIEIAKKILRNEITLLKL